MPLLSLSQLQIIDGFLKDPDGKVALLTFFDKEKRYYLDQCTSQMLLGNVELAKKAAHFATVYETIMLELQHFVDNQRAKK